MLLAAEFPIEINETAPTMDDKQRLIRTVQFIDTVLADLIDSLHKIHQDGDYTATLPPDFGNMLADLDVSFARERAGFLDVQEKLQTTEREKLVEHRLVGKLLGFKTRVFETIYNAAKSAIASVTRPIPIHPRDVIKVGAELISPMSTLIGSICSACGLTAPSEFLESLGQLFKSTDTILAN